MWTVEANNASSLIAVWQLSTDKHPNPTSEQKLTTEMRLNREGYFPSGARSFHSGFDWGCLWSSDKLGYCLFVARVTVSDNRRVKNQFAIFATPCWLLSYTSEYWSWLVSADMSLWEWWPKSDTGWPFCSVLTSHCFHLIKRGRRRFKKKASAGNQGIISL